MARADAGPTIQPGPPIVFEPRPVLDHEVRACSFRTPVCVHAASRVDGGRVLAVLDAADRAYDTLTGALDLPRPDLDPDALSYDVYLVDGAREANGEDASTHLDGRDVRSNVDRARAFTVLDSAVVAGCALDGAMARALAHASLYRAAPATSEAIAGAMTTSLAALASPCSTALLADAADAFQDHPELGVALGRVDAASVSNAWRYAKARADVLHARGASFFWSRIDWAFSRIPGGIVRAVWALSPTTTPLGARRWNDEPDAFDVLRVTFKDALSRGSTLADLFHDVAIARAFVGSADDGRHQPEWRTLGDAAALVPTWQLPWPDAPRRVAAARPVHPSGSAYIAIARSPNKDAKLRLEIAWEEHALFRWTLVKIDARGRELGRIPIPARERAVEAQMTFVDLGEADRLLLVGTNTGDPAYYFDPDDEVWEPHGFLVTMAEEK